MGRVLNHSLAIDEKISQLNELWPEIVRKYEARVREEIDDPELFRQSLRRSSMDRSDAFVVAFNKKCEPRFRKVNYPPREAICNSSESRVVG